MISFGKYFYDDKIFMHNKITKGEKKHAILHLEILI